jgi:hypothetical protein
MRISLAVSLLLAVDLDGDVFPESGLWADESVDHRCYPIRRILLRSISIVITPRSAR